jgi:Cd2+/Zn2+-exporting ATPase
MLDENFLMALATIVAFAIGEYAEGVAVMLFYRVGQLTEDYALNRSKSNISKLLDLKPDMARIVRPDGFKEVHPEVVVIDQILSVRPGEKIPLDGEIIKGETSLDTAMLTGESLPRSVEVGDEVLAGTVNLEGVIEIRVTKSYDDSAVSKILNLVREANSNKAVTEKFITKFAKVYTPMVVVAATLLALVPPLLFGQSFDTWLYRGAIFLVVSCPCALVISIPLGYFGGLGGAARKGVLIKGGHYLEVLKKSKTLILDKTGTLTKGNFKLKDVDLHGAYSKDEILVIAAHIEAYSNHPIAKAVVEAYGHAVDMELATNIKEIPGKGLEGNFKDHKVVIGNKSLMTLKNYEIPKEKTQGTVLYVGVDHKVVAVLLIEDEIKDHSLEGINRLKKLGFDRIVMLTGDQQSIADQVAGELGIDEVYGELLPEDKLKHVEDIIEESSPVMFVGDGINDAPVLTRADVGISMGQLGSDVAIESSDVVLMQDEITKVADAVSGARFTSNIIWQNIVLALGVKAIIMVLGAIGIANLWIAVFGDVGVAFLAILNAGRAIYQK